MGAEKKLNDRRYDIGAEKKLKDRRYKLGAEKVDRRKKG